MIDKYDAPEGYIAVAEGNEDCTGCAFDNGPYCGAEKGGDLPRCASHRRKDGHNVIFKKNEVPVSNSGCDAYHRAKGLMFLLIDIEKRKHPELRRGQIAYNIMFKIDHDLCLECTDYSIDPFYDDSKLGHFLEVCLK